LVLPENKQYTHLGKGNTLKRKEQQLKIIQSKNFGLSSRQAYQM
jgi:hypothetical protein